MSKVRFINHCSDTIDTLEVKGQAVYVEESFDAFTTTIGVEKVSFNLDEDFTTITGGDHGQWQRPFVINAPFDVDEDWTEKYIIPICECKQGVTVYVYLGGDGDPYGDCIVGIFTRKLTEEELSIIENDEDSYIDEVYKEPIEITIQ